MSCYPVETIIFHIIGSMGVIPVVKTDGRIFIKCIMKRNSGIMKDKIIINSVIINPFYSCQFITAYNGKTFR